MDPLDRLRAALVDRYEVDREVGRGGMAIVYLARDLRHDRDVAIKVLKPEFATAVPAERFLREIRIVAQLKHPYILPLFDSGDADGVLYYVMPYVQGQSLRARLHEETQLPLQEALRITGEVAEALSYAHTRGLVHCDVKPGNILLDGEHALLADFGIARAVTAAGGEALTSTGLIVGTPEYMSPEQGSYHGKLDARSDIYALGCVLYEMLSGEPPFTGPTAQSIIARHMHDEPRSLRVVRSTIPKHIETAIQVSLAKVPADRFPSAEQFVAALGPEGEAATLARETPKARRSRVRRTAGVLAGVAVVSSVAIWRLAMPTTQPLDPNKLVLFPLTERMLSPSDSGTGYDVAIMLSAALEHAHPLKWIDGAQRLSALAARNPAMVSGGALRDAALEQRARYYIDGVVMGGSRESTTVVLRLHDAKGDSVVVQESASAPRDSATAVQLALKAATRLLPALLDPGRSIDLSALSARKASATALWIQGEREYRRSRFRSALDLYRRSVGEDSAMAFAALKGAQAASWENLGSDALELVATALSREALLPSKQRAFARGLQAYLEGAADTAVVWLTKAVAEDPEWAEGHMALGEVYYHLLPVVPLPLDSLAHAEFSKAVRYDSGFAPPLFHLAEIAVREGDTTAAADLIGRFHRFDPDSSRGRQLAMLSDCLEKGSAGIQWSREVAINPMDVLQAARSLSVGGAHFACAERGFRALLADSMHKELHWGAFLGLHGIVMSQRRLSEVVPLIDSAVAGGLGRASAMYFVDALIGAPVDARAEAVAADWRAKYGENYEQVSLAARWLLAAWHAHRRDTVRLQSLRDAMLADSQTTDLPIREALDGQLALARGDTAAAAGHFRALRVTVPAEALEWGLAEPMALERLVIAQYALGHGDAAEAYLAAAGFDHPAPVAYLPYLPLSLDIRMRAAERMGRSDLVSRMQARLRRLRSSEVALSH
ncbi:MAG TPA: protein kinase [Gemmatimonadales bacterium]